MPKENNILEMEVKKIFGFTYTIFLITFTTIGCNESKSQANKEMKNIMNENNPNLETATFGSGCFWCTEAIFERVNGVSVCCIGLLGWRS